MEHTASWGQSSWTVPFDLTWSCTEIVGSACTETLAEPLQEWQWQIRWEKLEDSKGHAPCLWVSVTLVNLKDTWPFPIKAPKDSSKSHIMGPFLAQALWDLNSEITVSKKRAPMANVSHSKGREHFVDDFLWVSLGTWNFWPCKCGGCLGREGKSIEQIYQKKTQSVAQIPVFYNHFSVFSTALYCNVFIPSWLVWRSDFPIWKPCLAQVARKP